MMDLIKAIAENGVLIVIAAVYLWHTNKQTENRNKQYDQMFQKLFAKPIITPAQETEIRTYESNVNEVLSDLLYSTDSARAFYIRFHNGGHDMTGKSFLKMTMTNEICRPGIAHMMGDMKDQLQSLFLYIINIIITDGIFVCENIHDLQTDSNAMFDFFNTRNIKKTAAAGVYNSNKQLVGVVGIEYMKENIMVSRDVVLRKLDTSKIKIETLINI